MEPYTVEVTFDENRIGQLESIRKLLRDLASVEDGNHGLAKLVAMVGTAKELLRAEYFSTYGVLDEIWADITVQAKQRAADGTNCGT
jgi:hypothetical protein